MKNSNFFWVSFSDLMLSMFFIVLVLFVVTIMKLQSEKKATEEQLEKIEELQTSIQALPERYFTYQPEYKRHILNEQIQFDSESHIIKPKYHTYLINVGNSIDSLVTSLSADENYKNMDIKYLVVIEGMASIDKYIFNFELSYQRALALYKFWEKNGIKFDKELCEVQIAGSGMEGVREFTNRKEEYKNQRFLIHIVPKIGKLDKENEE